MSIGEGQMSIARLCLGTAKLGMPWYGAGSISRPTPEETAAILRRACELGIRAYDTGAAYGDAEDWVLHALPPPPRGAAEHLRITKVSPALASVGAAIKRMADPRWQSVLLHNPQPRDLVDWRRWIAPSDRSRLGASVYTPQEADAVRRAGIYGNLQVPYCLMDRRFEEFMAGSAAGYEDGSEPDRTGIFARQPFLQGLLSNWSDGPAAMRRWAHAADLNDWPASSVVMAGQFHRICLDWDIEPLRAALWFSLDSPADFVVFGVGSVSHLEEVVEAAEAYVRNDRWLSLRADLVFAASTVPPLRFDSLWKR